MHLRWLWHDIQDHAGGQAHAHPYFLRTGGLSRRFKPYGGPRSRPDQTFYGTTYQGGAGPYGRCSEYGSHWRLDQALSLILGQERRTADGLLPQLVTSAYDPLRGTAQFRSLCRKRELSTSPDKKPGDRTDFQDPYLFNITVYPLP